MSDNSMVDQVNRLVEDRLLAGEALALPGVGSLYTERRGARRISRQLVEPPSRRIVFSPQMRGVSLIEVIVSVAQCDEETANKVYSRWLEAVQSNGELRIEGVGTLRNKHFASDPAFDEVLNPQGHAPLRMENGRRSDWALWLGIVAIVGVLGFVAYWWFSERDSSVDLKFFENPFADHEGAIARMRGADSGEEMLDFAVAAAAEGATDAALESVETTATTETDEANETADAEDAGMEKSSAEASETVADADAEASESEHSEIAAIQSALSRATFAPEGTPDAPAALVPGRSYVVIGVFSDPENAAKRIREIEKMNPSLHCSVYRCFGDKLMLSPYESATVADCRAFMRLQRGLFPDLWPYTAH